MSENSYRDCLEELIDRIERIERYVESMTFEEFGEDRRTVDAVVRNIEVIGETANRLPDGFRDRYDQVEWRGVLKFRDAVIDDSFGVDAGRIWDTVNKNLPVLKKQLEEILETDTFRELLRGSEPE